MNIHSKSSRRAYALLVVLGVVGVAALVAASTIRRTYGVVQLNQRANQYQASMYAAEAAVEKVYAQMRQDYVTGGDSMVANNLATYRGMVPLATEDPHFAGYEFSNAIGAADQTYVRLIQNRVNAVLTGGYAGLSGWRGVYRVVSNARPTTGLYPVGAAVQQDVALDTIPAFQFAIFYNGQLEFTWCAPLVVRGRTHANGPVCLGPASGSSLKFLGTVTTTSSITTSNLGGYKAANMTGTVTYSGTPPSTTGVPSLQLPIGVNNTPAAVRDIINPPPGGESPTSPLGQQRYYNKAAVVVLVGDTSVTLNIKHQGDSTGTFTNIPYTAAAPTYAQLTNLAVQVPFLSLTNKFKDQRENKTVTVSQVDMGKLNTWLTNNTTVRAYYPDGSGRKPSILYVGDFRTGTQLNGVRLANAQRIPSNSAGLAQAMGLTVATPNPLYVWGNYNCPNSAHLGTTNTSATVPASLVSDALTILSPNWNDATYGGTYGLDSRNAANTTVNAAIIAGAVYSTGSAEGQWSGGVHNLPRLLENWSDDTLTLNTSLVNLYNSIKATTQFRNPGDYYRAPNRNFNFDQNFLDLTKLPPGTPTLSVISRLRWTTAPLNTVTYNAP
jgi:hypothetical protein